MNQTACNANRSGSSKVNCASCFFASPDEIPDPNVKWEKGMGTKPRIEGYRCHAVRPSTTGFPPVTEDSFCAFFTECGTYDQPIRHLVNEGRTA